MPQVTATGVNDWLRQLPLLDAAQKEELPRLEAVHGKPRELVQELVKRGWLTVFQGTQLLQGKGEELALGQYVLLEKVGEGGMGQVYKARQCNLDRMVALKVIRKECLDNPKVIARFQREIRAAGHLSHPNIVRAYDADQAGATYFIAMEFLDGIDLAKKVKDEGPLPVDEACEFIRQAAVGLQHAHERGLVHRDIKPANLFVVNAAAAGKDKKRQSSAVLRRPSAGQLALPRVAADAPPVSPYLVKILDLGLARWDDPTTGRASTHLTQMGHVMGTSEFISPEQARNSHTCDIRADLYSLGCTFYFLLAGRAPFIGGSLAEKLIQHQVDEATPVGTLRQAMLVNFRVRKGTPKAPRQQLAVPEHVAAIVKKLMAKRPEDRYQTPGELAQVLDEALARLAQPADANANEAVAVESIIPMATPVQETTMDAPLVKVASFIQPSRRARPRRPWPRRRWLTFSGVAAGVFLVLVLAGRGGNQAKPRAGDAEAKEAKRAPADDSAWKALQADVQRQALPAAELRAKLLDFKRQHPARARDVAALFGQVPSPLDALERAKIDAKQWFAWMPEEIVGVLGMWRGFQGYRATHSIAVSPDARWIAGSDGERAVRIWDTAAPAFPWSLANPTWSRITRVAIAPDGKLLATANDDGAVRIYDVAHRQLLHTLEKHQRPATCLAFHPHAPLLASAGYDGVVHLWNTAGGVHLADIQTSNSKIFALSFTPDGKHVLWGGDNQEVQWATSDGATLKPWKFAANAGPVKTLAFHPDNQTLVCGGHDGALRLCTWDGNSIKEKTVLHRHDKTVNDAAFAPDGRSFATVADDAQLILWDAAGGAVKKSWTLRFPIHAVAYAPDGRHLLTANANGTVYILRPTEAAAMAQAR